MPEPILVEFKVEKDETGTYCASSQVGTHSLATQGQSLDELNTMIEDLLELFSDESGVTVLSYRLLMHCSPRAA